ncbi:MAG: hypothetical protein M1833_000328 [Piccolia ochrophora]|nr:MAG: hypothetical protein M1833_000328 [Piccolia ochrophora]
MLSRRLAAVARRPILPLKPTSTPPQIRCLSQAEIEDPNMNGGYVNPPKIKRQFRDPYGDWWDKQERRNFGEPIHEDNDVLAIFSPYEYTHAPPGKAALHFSMFVATVAGLAGVVSLYYPDKPSVPREYPGGLDVELGGPGALRARKAGDE